MASCPAIDSALNKINPNSLTTGLKDLKEALSATCPGANILHADADKYKQSIDSSLPEIKDPALRKRIADLTGAMVRQNKICLARFDRLFGEAEKLNGKSNESALTLEFLKRAFPESKNLRLEMKLSSDVVNGLEVLERIASDLKGTPDQKYIQYANELIPVFEVEVRAREDLLRTRNLLPSTPAPRKSIA